MISRRSFCTAFVFLLLLPALLGAADVPSLRVGESLVTVMTYGPNPAQREVRPKVALVLSGGGARGFAHIPIIEAVERMGIPVDMVLGTSMGSLVGGLYAAGYSPGDMRRLISSYDMIEMFAISALPPLRPEPLTLRRYRDNLFQVGFDEKGLGTASGIIGDQRILQMLNDALSRVAGINDFDRLAIPFRCIGTDVVTGERIVFSSGSLVSAIRGSISIPLVFPPYPVDGHLVIDGGLVDNLPVSLAREMGADIIIAVDVNAVDYDVEPQQLESLTAILGQLVVILTKNTVVSQSDDADLLITPELTDQGILDFIEVDAILAIGEQAAFSHTADLEAIATSVSESRPLRVLDPERYGPYFSLPDVFVRSISHRDAIASESAEETQFDLSPFSHYVGYPLDTLRKRNLARQFDELRESGRYATVTYDYTDVTLGKSDTVWGNLEIRTRTYAPKRSAIAAGLFGATSVLWDADGTASFEFKPDFSLRYLRYGALDWTLAVTNDDALQFFSVFSRPFGKSWRYGFELGYRTGGIHPTNLRAGVKGAQERDRMILSEMMIQFMPNSRFLMKLATDFDYIWYGDPIEAHHGMIYALRFDLMRNTMAYGFFPRRGTRIDLRLSGELTGKLGYLIQGRFQAAVPVGERDTLAFDLHAGSSHVGLPRKDVYFDYGGSRGMPTYGTTSLVDDMLLLRLKHQHRFVDASVGVLSQAMIVMGIRGDTVDEIFSTDGYGANSGFPFSSLAHLEFGASIALGLSFDNLDVLFGTAIDNALRVSLFLEVL
ncbi:MAG: patatin-like phospholipase family protein [Sphaerochaetaceae bacterium]